MNYNDQRRAVHPLSLNLNLPHNRNRGFGSKKNNLLTARIAYGANVLTPNITSSYDLDPNRVSSYLRALSPQELQILQGVALGAAYDIARVRRQGDTGMLLDYGAACGLSENAVLRICDIDDKYDILGWLGEGASWLGNTLLKGAEWGGNLVGNFIKPLVGAVAGPFVSSSPTSPTVTQSQVNIPQVFNDPRMYSTPGLNGSFTPATPIAGTNVSSGVPQPLPPPSPSPSPGSFTPAAPITGTSVGNTVSIMPVTQPGPSSTTSAFIETVAKYVIPAFIPGVGYQQPFTPAAPITGSQVSYGTVPSAQPPQFTPLQGPVFIPSAPVSGSQVSSGVGAVYNPSPVPTPPPPQQQPVSVPSQTSAPTTAPTTGSFALTSNMANWNEILNSYKVTTAGLAGWPPAETVLLAIIEHFATGQGYATAKRIGYKLDGRIETRMCTHCDASSVLSAPMSGIFYSTPWFSAELTDLPSGVYGMINTDKKPFRIRLNRNVPFPRMMVSAAHETLHAMADLYKLNVSHDQIHGLAFFLVDNVIPLLNSLSDLQHKEQLKQH